MRGRQTMCPASASAAKSGRKSISSLIGQKPATDFPRISNAGQCLINSAPAPCFKVRWKSVSHLARRNRRSLCGAAQRNKQVKSRICGAAYWPESLPASFSMRFAASDRAFAASISLCSAERRALSASRRISAVIASAC